MNETSYFLLFFLVSSTNNPKEEIKIQSKLQIALDNQIDVVYIVMY